MLVRGTILCSIRISTAATYYFLDREIWVLCAHASDSACNCGGKLRTGIVPSGVATRYIILTKADSKAFNGPIPNSRLLAGLANGYFLD